MCFRKFSTILSSACIAVYLSACGISTASAPPETGAQASAPLPVRVILPQVTEIFARYHTTATISSDADAPISARVGGEIVAILVEEGDHVEKGQVLARLDGERLGIEVKQAKANLEKTSREHERSISLHARGLVSTAAFDDMKFELDALRANYELKKLNYAYTEIRASISGVVSARHVKVGQHLNEGDTTFRITDPSALQAYLQIPQNELARFSVGHVASVQVDAMTDEVFPATIARISPTIDMQSGTFRATAFIDNSNDMLAPGMFGRFEIAYERHADALVIPVAAILEEDNVSVIYVVEDGAAVRRLVTTGIEENGMVEILEGLSEPEQVVVTGQRGIRDGSKVLASLSAATPITG